MSLTQDLAAQRDKFLATATPAFRAQVDALLGELRRTQVGASAPAVGDIAPDFELTDANGKRVRLSARRASGPVILAFYRGGWCPYCNLQLRAYQNELPRITELGAKIVAVSPQAPDASLDTAQRNALAFDVLSDVGSHVARAYGLAFSLPEDLREVYRERKIVLPEINAAEDWTLPLPATFVIGQDGRVRLAHIEADYRARLDPEDAIRALSG